MEWKACDYTWNLREWSKTYVLATNWVSLEMKKIWGKIFLSVFWLVQEQEEFQYIKKESQTKIATEKGFEKIEKDQSQNQVGWCLIRGIISNTKS